MSDENMTNIDNDDTSALFVSSQKKKKAEEEARKKAEEEKAKREAAEAEVRRMEQEVEERRRKAEAEKEALENAAKKEVTTVAPPISEPVKAAPETVEKPVAKSKSKKPLFIALGAVAAVIVIFLIVGNLGGGGFAPGTDYSALAIDTEYKTKADGFDFTFSYPKSIYSDVTETRLADNMLELDFVADNKSEVTTNVVLTDSYSDNTLLERNNIVFFHVSDIQKTLKETSKSMLEKLIPGVSVSEQVVSEYSESDPKTYTCTYKFTSENYKSGAAVAYLAPNGSDVYEVVLVSCAHSGEIQEEVEKIRDKFAGAIPENAYSMPGAKPPTSTDADDIIEDTISHLGLHVPGDRFVRYTKTQNYNLYSDLNGTYLIVQSLDSKLDFSTNDYADEDVDKYMRDNAATGINFYFSDITSRTLENESIDLDRVTLNFEYKDTIENVTYYEYYHLSHWTDMKTNKKYWITIVVLSPYKDKDIYKQIFESSIDNLLDI
ncbi:hypothetical protein [Butyrivibrio sp. AE3006]|uniref:hypothetical protein n=1 Tax=Butyrivibrio sp. AE3006 TaxID=1280673 RepID=UPI0004226A35|nr:hypothetical protein [Butyrivibrio sp. AE3006]